MRTYLMKLLVQLALLGLSCVLSSLSVFIPVTIHNREELSQVNLGFPDSISRSKVKSGCRLAGLMDQSFPSQRTFISPWENVFQVRWGHFLLNIAIIFLILNLIYSFIQIYLAKIPHTHLPRKSLLPRDENTS